MSFSFLDMMVFVFRYNHIFLMPGKTCNKMWRVTPRVAVDEASEHLIFFPSLPSDFSVDDFNSIFPWKDGAE